MLWTIFVILLILWLLGFSFHIAGSLIHVLLVVAVLMAAALAYSLSSLAGVARAEGPGSGTPYTVSVGDSYISGEAGRWAGNTNGSSSNIDALGSTAYDDNSAGNGRQHRWLHIPRTRLQWPAVISGPARLS